MSGDSGDSSSDHSEKPSCSRRITRRSKNAATTASCSTSANVSANGSGNKKKRRIVMRIEFDGDSDDTSTISGSSSALSEVDDDDDDGGIGSGGGRGNKRKAGMKKRQKNNFIDDEDDIKPCSTKKLRGKLGKKTNFVFSSDDINKKSSEDDMPGSAGRRNNRHQRNNKNRLRNRQRLEDNNDNDDDDDDDDDFDEKNNANGGERGSSNGREIARTVGSRKRTIISDDEADNSNVASSTVQGNNRDEENGFNSDSSSNELLEKCPICLLTFRTQEIGSPATCEHIFCANCIEAWSKNVQTCPIDRIEFDRIVVRESYENRELVREINVNKTNGAEKLNHDLSDEDVTHCEVCNRPDREDVMLLCDSCNQGYHIDCLTPPLTDVPEGSWYCDNCFDSENSDDSDMVDDLNVLYEDIRDMGIPESRYRVTEVHQPRILRTRQNERIRAAILSRTRSSARNQAAGADGPSTSNGVASSSRASRAVRNSSRTTRTPKTRRRRKRRARQRTYVVEYDLNNFDEKFAIKTTKRVIRRRRRRRRTRTAAPRCRQMENTGERMTASKRLAEQLGVKSTDREVRAAASSQSFSLFGNANDLEYFSDSDGGLQSEIQIETGGGGSTAVQTSVRISNFRSHRSKKGLLSRLEREQPSSTPDLLSNIMELQDRWHNASRHLDSVRIGQDGSLNLPSSSEVIANPTANTSPAKPSSTSTQPSSGVNQNDVTEAPMYPRGGGGNNRNFNSGGSGGNGNTGTGGNYNNRYNSQSNYRGGSGGGSSGGGQFRSSFGSSTTPSAGNLFSMVGRGNFSFSSQTFNQNNDNDNNGPNNNSNNRDRFNQRNNNNNNNNNNRNNRNSLPLFNTNQTNDNISSLTSNPPPLQQQPSPQQTLQPPPQLMPPRPLLSIPPVTSIQPPPFQLPAHQPLQPTPTIPSLSSLPLPPPIGLYSSLPPTSAPPPLFRPPPILSQPPPIIPMRPPPPAIPPLAAPPAFNSSLFQLTADYGNDDDDDSNCPNFSVYSMESLQVAKSDVKAASETKGDTPKEDDENEDLVQLSDDDEMMGNNEEDIPLPPPLEKKIDNADETAESERDLYEPDQPTVESENDSDGNEDESKVRSENNETAGSQTPPDVDMELENPDNSQSSLNATAKKSQDDTGDEAEAEAVESAPQESDKEDEETTNLLDIQLPESTKKVEQSQRKGVLELYDDSDWEELNMEKPTAEDYQLIATPPLEEKKSQENEKENNESGDESDVEGKQDDDAKNNDTEGVEKIDKPEENCTPSPGSIETELNAEERADDDDEKDKEQDRSYTPCLDEKNDNIDEDENDGTCTPELIPPLALTSGLDGAKNANESGSATAVDAAGIAGMETELISEEDDADKRDKRKRSKGEKDKEQFKKISKNQRDRNYRIDRASTDRFRNRRGRSRSRTNDKENQGFQHRRAMRGRFKRRELPRYNVRNVVNQRNFKDRYGRDTSRPRSASRPRRRRSFSRSVSRSRSRSPSKSRSRSRSLSSPSKRPRRSFSISPSPPIVRRISISPRRRMRSPINRSPVRRNSRTPLRMRSRSTSPVRRLIKHKNKRGPGKRSVSPGKRSRSLSRFTPRLSRSRTPPRHKPKRVKDRKKKKAKKRQASPSSQRSRSRLERRKGSAPPTKRKRHHTPKAKSPVVDQGWSPSPSPPRNYLHDNVSWTPPLMSPAGVSRLRRNEEYNEFSISSKPPKEKKKREKKKKKSEKRRGEIARKEKRRRDAAPNAPSKEVFASGNNILVSVSFNKEGNQPQQTTVVTLPPTREEVLASIRGRSKERQNDQQPKKKKKKDGREKKRKKLDTKPVAIIDLERSPFQVTQEQTDIIILTDSEAGGNDEENLNVSRESANEMMTQMDHHHPREGSSHRTVNSDKTPPLERLESILEESYENAIQQQGPKTPPEPPGGIKFNLINKNKQKISRNALHEEAELDSDGHREEERQEERDSMAQNANKIGPNTPPESGPCSPDVYDPFDPTKSPSMSPRSPTPPPDMSHDSVPDTDPPSKHSTEDLRTEPRQPGPPGVGNSEKSTLNPVDLVMALMNNKANTSQDSVHKSNESQYNSNQVVVNLIDENDKPEENSAIAGITVLSNVILSSGKSQHIPSISSPPLSKASSHKPPKLTNILSNLPGLGNRHNGGGIDDIINDIESPYSPGSADYEDLFEPPPDTNGTKRRRGDKRGNKTGEVFESLFGSSSPPPPGAGHLRLPTSTARKHKSAYTARNKHKTIVKVSKLPGTSNDDHVKVYDDLPNSAVELQVKDKFLRKLNRQERVVEEVKMILKPRFNKKQITKDDYKEIMRRAVPKICHSKSGEINPKKIQNLIEAYVKKFRQKHKKLNIPNTGQVSSAVKCAAYLKKL